MTKIKLSEALAIISAPRDVAVDRALEDSATVEDIARAAALVRKVTSFGSDTPTLATTEIS